MPRDSSGAYSLPSGSLVNTGDTILVSQHNPPFQDIEEAISGSLDRDGKGGMRADLNVSGNRVVNVANAVAGTDAVPLAQVQALIPSTPEAADPVPIGAVLDYWGASAPTGYLFPIGQAVSRTTYAALFAIIGTSAGAGDGSTTFNLPDYRGRVGAGKDDMGGVTAGRLSSYAGTTLGAGFGAQEVVLTEAQLATHDHAVSDPGHSHTYAAASGAGNYVDSGSGVGSITTSTGAATTGVTVDNAGGGEAHANVQPTIVCNKIMKVS